MAAPLVADPTDIVGILAGISFGISALVIWVFHRDRPESSARFLLVLWMGMISGICISLSLLLWGVTRHLSASLIFTSILIGLGSCVVIVLLTRTRMVWGFVVLAVVLTAVGLTTYREATLQVDAVEAVATLWESKGFPVDVLDVFPQGDTTKECKPWFSSIHDSGSEGLELFYKMKVGELSADVTKAMEKGESIRRVLREEGITEDPYWEELLNINANAIAALNECPYVQSFDPETYKDRIMEVPLPDLLDAMRWSRGMFIQALIQADEGDMNRALETLGHLKDASKKFQVPGQILITSLISIAMDKMAAHGYAAVQTMNSRAWSPEIRSVMEDGARLKAEWARSLYDGERYTVFSALQMKEVHNGLILADQNDAFIPSWRPLWRAALRRETERDLNTLTLLTGWMYSVPDFTLGDLAWHDARVKMAGWGYGKYLPNFTSSYARLVSLSAAWNLTLAQDRIYAIYAKKGVFPEIEEILKISDWPIDPFDGQPLRYKKLGPRSFIVYSVGPDEIDGEGADLYVSGVMKADMEKDIGYRVSSGP